MSISRRLLPLLALLLFPTPAAAAPAREPQIRILVPAYFYPAGNGLKEWDRLIQAAAEVPIVAIANPASGPGTRVDPNYTRVLDRAAKAGIRLIGYITTSYAKRPVKDVTADVETWYRFYPQIQGIFFDEQASSKEHVPYHQAIRKAVKGLVVTNPGTLCAPEFVTERATDVACVYENKEGFARFKRLEWSANLPPDRFAALPYAIPTAAQMRTFVKQTLREGLGYFYVTDHEGANPWDRLPSYWDEELAAVKDANAAQKPGPYTYIPQTHWLYDSFNQLAQRGIVTGYSDGTYGGRPAYTRYQMASFVVGMLDWFDAPAPAHVAYLLRKPKAGRDSLVWLLARMTRELEDELRLQGVWRGLIEMKLDRAAAVLGLNEA
jgi:hypothetical protein